MKARPNTRLSNRAMAFVLAGGRGSRLKELTDRRAKPAVYFGGKTRIIDFALSNALNSGIRKMAVATQYKAHSLIRHMQRGWGFLRAERNEYLDILPASQRVDESKWYMGTADAVTQNIDIVDDYGIDFIIILAGDHIYKMDYEIMLRQHVDTGADVTIGCLTVPRMEATAFGVMDVDKKGRITKFLEKPKDPPSIPGDPDHALASMGIYVFRWDFLRDLLLKDMEDTNSSHDFGNDLIPAIVKSGKAIAHRFEESCVTGGLETEPYWRDVGTIDAFWQANIDLTKPTPPLDLYDSSWPVWTYAEIVPPAKFIHSEKGRTGSAIGSLVSGGCIVSGAEVRDSLLFTGVRAHSWAVLDHVVALPYADIGRKAELANCVIDRGVNIPDGLVVGKDPVVDAKFFRRTESGIVLITQPMVDAWVAAKVIKVLSVASECVPLVKTGGLADVVGALPRALAGQGVDMRVMLPAYPGLIKKIGKVTEIATESDFYGGSTRVLKGAFDGVTILLLDAPHLYARDGGIYGNPNDYPDNPERFAAFSFAAAQIGMHGGRDGWVPDILHAHDWQAALAPAFVRWADDKRLKTVLTVHNIAFQGIAPSSRMGAMQLPGWAYNADGYEYWGNISALKAGLVTADKLSTVSPSYASELMRGEYGMGLDGVIRARAGDMIGILNGVDTQVWDPATDPAITPYSARSIKAKARNRAALMTTFGLSDIAGPLAIVVSRLTGQKGIDLIADVAPDFVADGGGIAILGTGEPYFEDRLSALARALPGRVAVKIGYDEDLSHQMFAGGDAVLVPSRFEPCGLTQMYGLRYGTIPVVAATGGLNDTVIDANSAAISADAATGFMFHPTDALALRQTLRRFCALYRDPKAWSAMQVRAMKSDVSWDASSAAYLGLYQGLMA